MITSMSYPDLIRSLGGLVAHYRLNERTGNIARDSSGNDLHGTYTNVTLGELEITRTGTAHAALITNNSVLSHVSLPPSNTLWTGWSGLTLACWMKMTTKTGRHARLIELGAYGDRLVSRLYLFSNNRLASEFFSSVGTVYSVTTPNSNYAPDDLRGHMVAVTYDGSWLRLYGDARLLATSSASGLTASNGGDVTTPLLGHGYSYSSYVGALQDVSIFRRALTSSEIATLYRVGNTLELMPRRSIAAVNPVMPRHLFGRVA